MAFSGRYFLLTNEEYNSVSQDPKSGEFSFDPVPRLLSRLEADRLAANPLIAGLVSKGELRLVEVELQFGRHTRLVPITPAAIPHKLVIQGEDK